ncbi:MAG: hypothetical protein FGM61_08770, partial [Sediminibacterium sp.]|nr:hypothetical protein [Sediminibacterium sp.]
ADESPGAQLITGGLDLYYRSEHRPRGADSAHDPWIDRMGGSVAAVESGYMQDEIASSAYRFQQELESGKKVIVGLNRFQEQEAPPQHILRINDAIREERIQRLQSFRASRDNAKTDSCLNDLRQVARDGGNIMPPVLEAVENRATLGEIADVLRGIYGEHKG